MLTLRIMNGKPPYKYQEECERAMAAGDLQEALKLYKRALAVDATNGDILNDRAICYYRMGEKGDALDDLNRAIMFEPDYGYRYASRAWMRSDMKDIEGAIEDYKKAIELDPEDAISLNNLGLLEEQLGYTQKARERFERADALKNLLQDSGVSMPKPPEPVNLQQEIDAEKAAQSTSPQTPTAKDHLRQMFNVMTSRNDLKEFIRFVSRGFRLDDEDK